LLEVSRQRDRADRAACRASAAAGSERLHRLKADSARREADGARQQSDVASAEAQRESRRATREQQIADSRRTEAERAGQRARRAEQKATEKLWQSYLAQARALRFSGRAGRRFEALAVLEKAAAIRPSLALRNEAIACMALADIRVASRAIQLPPEFGGVGFDRDYHWYACGDPQGNITLRRLADAKPIVRLPGFGWPIVEIGSPSEDGRFLPVYYQHDRSHDALAVWALRQSNDTLVVWDLRGRRPILRTPAGVAPIGRAAFSSDDDILAVAYRDGSLHLFELPSGNELRRFPPGPAIRAIAWRPGARQLAVTASQSHAVRIVDAGSGAAVQSLPHPDDVDGLAWSPDGRLLATGCEDRELRIWKAASGRQLSVSQEEETPSHLDFSKDGDLLASASWDATIRLWDPGSGKELVRADAPLAIPQFSSDDHQVGYFLRTTPENLGLLELAPAREYRALYGPPGPDNAFWGMDFDPTSQFLVAGGRKGVQLWELIHFREMSFLPVGFTQSVYFDTGGRELITSGDTGLNRRPLELDPSTGEPTIGIGKPVGDKVADGRIARSADGHTLAVIKGFRIFVLDPTNPRSVRQPDGLPGVLTIAISPDGRWVAAGGWGSDDVKIQVCDLLSNTRRNLPITGTAHVAFSPDGKWLVTGRIEDYQFWRVGTWQPGLRIPRERAADAVGGRLAFSPDGKILAINPSSGFVELIDSATGREVAILEPPSPERLNGLTFSPDGSRLAAGTMYGRIDLWDLRLIRRQLKAMGLDWSDPR
jgi:WD40 repeat protein